MERIKRTTSNRLDTIETKMFESGNSLVKTFEDNNSLPAIRFAVQCYRVSMQAMRDKIRYTAKK